MRKNSTLILLLLFLLFVQNKLFAEDYTTKTFLKINAGDHFISAIDDENQIWIWGKNNYGQCGEKSGDKLEPWLKADQPPYFNIALGDRTTHAIDTSGTLWAWGYNETGNLGINEKTQNKYDAVKVTPETKYKQISASTHYLALDTDGNIWSWGYNNYGQLGDGTQVDKIAPVKVKLDREVIQVSAGLDFSMALDYRGRLYMWGSNINQQLTSGDIERMITTPIHVFPDKKFVSISAGGFHAMAIDTDGGLWVWGKNFYQCLGIGSTSNGSYEPQQLLPNKTFIAAQASYNNSFMIDSEGTLYSAGSNDFGQLGNGTTEKSSTPIVVQENTKFKDISCEKFCVAALDDANRLWTWGLGSDGQVGNNTGKSSSTPVLLSSAVIPLKEISLNKLILNLETEDTFQLTCTTKPSNATNDSIIWTSSDESVATVDANGLVTAIKEGESIVAAEAYLGSSVAKCRVKVSQKSNINKKQNNSLLTIYPNPVDNSGLITLKTEQDFKYQILNLSGQILSKGEVTATSNTIRLPESNSEIFFIKLYNNQQSITRQIIQIK